MSILTTHSFKCRVCWTLVKPIWICGLATVSSQAAMVSWLSANEAPLELEFELGLMHSAMPATIPMTQEAQMMKGSKRIIITVTIKRPTLAIPVLPKANIAKTIQKMTLIVPIIMMMMMRMTEIITTTIRKFVGKTKIIWSYRIQFQQKGHARMSKQHAMPGQRHGKGIMFQRYWTVRDWSALILLLAHFAIFMILSVVFSGKSKS